TIFFYYFSFFFFFFFFFFQAEDGIRDYKVTGVQTCALPISSVEFRVASNPEFLREGTAVEDFLHPDRIVLGVEDKDSEKQLREIYRPILEAPRGKTKIHCPVHLGGCPPAKSPELVVTTINSAELIKHASNSFLALKISY